MLELASAGVVLEAVHQGNKHIVVVRICGIEHRSGQIIVLCKGVEERGDLDGIAAVSDTVKACIGAELCKFCRVDISDRSVVKLRSPAETYIFGVELVENEALVFLSLIGGNLFTRKGFPEYCVNLVGIRFGIGNKIKSVIACTSAVSVEVFQP